MLIKYVGIKKTAPSQWGMTLFFYRCCRNNYCSAFFSVQELAALFAQQALPWPAPPAHAFFSEAVHCVVFLVISVLSATNTFGATFTNALEASSNWTLANTASRLVSASFRAAGLSVSGESAENKGKCEKENRFFHELRAWILMLKNVFYLKRFTKVKLKNQMMVRF